MPTAMVYSCEPRASQKARQESRGAEGELLCCCSEVLIPANCIAYYNPIMSHPLMEWCF